MAINFPTSLDTLTNPAAGDMRDDPSLAGEISDLNDIAEALEAKVGIDGSAVATSLDKRVAVLEAAGGGGAIAHILTVRIKTTTVVDPIPTSDTLIPSMTITVPASDASRVVILSATFNTNGHSNRCRVYLDSTQEYPANGSGGQFGCTSTDTQPAYIYAIAGIPITIPGDSATHDVKIMWQAQGSTGACTLYDRAMTILDPV